MTDATNRELSELRTRVRLLKEMAGHINSGLEGEQVIQRTLLDAHQRLPHLRISFGTVDAQGVLRVVSSVSPLNMPSIEGQLFEMPEAEVLARLLRLGQPIAIHDIEADQRMPEVAALMRRFSARSLLAIRVQHPEHQLAALSFATGSPRVWSDHEKEMITDIAEYLAIAIRENQMANEQLRAGEKLQGLQRMEAVGRLVGGVAHEFNNLLTGMMIYTGLLASALGPGNPLQRHVRELQAAGERGASLIGQLLSLSRQHVLEPRVTSLNDVVSGMREMLQRLVGADVLIECHLAGDLPETRLDENQIRQAILNLAVNARDAMQAGGRLELSTRVLHADSAAAARIAGMVPGDYAVLRVQDTGAGMTPETLARCFEPFFTTKPPGEGTGLGLAAVFGTVQQHGGYIDVRSTPGRGTAFDLCFPIAAPAGADVSAPVGAGRERKTVLLVEDEAMLRLPLAERLRNEGYEVLSASSGEGALEIAGRHPDDIDLLVTDLVLPGLCGHEIAGRISESRPELRVLFMSGYTDDVRARRLIAQGANFLRKPFRADELLAKVRGVMDGGQDPAAPPPGMAKQKTTSILGKGN